MRFHHTWCWMICLAAGIFFAARQTSMFFSLLLFVGLAVWIAKPLCIGKKQLLLCVLAMVIGVFYGTLRFRLAELPTEAYLGKTCSVIGTVEEVRPLKDRYAAFVKVQYIDGKKTNFRVYVVSSQKVCYQDKIHIKSVLNAPTVGQTSKDFDNRRWLMSKSVFSVMYPQKEEIQIMQREASSLKYNLPFAVRNKITEAVNITHDGNARAFALAIFSGQKEGMDASFKTALSRTGLSHVTAVSGLHVSLVISMVLGMFFLISERWRYLRVLGYAFILFFVLMVGAPASAVRAGMMHIIYITARIFRRNVHRLHTLLLVGFGMVTGYPFFIVDMGFQLSFMAVLGIFLFYERLEARIVGRAVRMKMGISILCASIAAQSFTLPVTAYSFGMVSLFGIVGNLILVPMLPAYIGIGFGYVLLYVLCPSAGLTMLVGEALRICSEAMTQLVCHIEKIPLCAISVPPFSPLLIPAAWLIGFSLCLRVIRKRLCACSAILVGIWLLLWMTSYFSLSVTDFAVGKGNFSLVQKGTCAVIVNCGSEDTSFDAIPLLAHRGVSRADALYITECKTMYLHGAQRLVAEEKIKALYVPKKDEFPREWELLFLQANRRGIDVYPVEKDNVLRLGDLWITARTNEETMEIFVHGEKHNILFTGEAIKTTKQCAVVKTYALDTTAKELFHIKPSFVMLSGEVQERETLPSGYGARVFLTKRDGTTSVYFTPWFSYVKIN